jgi:hypothetical protein
MQNHNNLFDFTIGNAIIFFMFNGFLTALILLLTSTFSPVIHNHPVYCKPGYQTDTSGRFCTTPTPTHKPSQTLKATPTMTPKPTPTAVVPSITPSLTPTMTPTVTPTATPTPTPVNGITEVKVHECTATSSCYGWLTDIEVNGYGFAADSRVKLKELIQSSPVFYGQYVGGNGTTSILTDFTQLPHCQHFDVIVYGSTGTYTAMHTITSVCP